MKLHSFLLSLGLFFIYLTSLRGVSEIDDLPNTMAHAHLSCEDIKTSLGSNSCAIAMAPDGKTAYLVNEQLKGIILINLATQMSESAIPLESSPFDIALSPDGTAAYVTHASAGTLTPVNLVTHAAGTAIAVGKTPTGIALSSDGKTAYVTDAGLDIVIPIDLETHTPGPAISVGVAPFGIAIAPDGMKAYVVHARSSEITPIDLTTQTAETAIALSHSPAAITLTPDGKTAYVTHGESPVITPIDLKTQTPYASIAMEKGSYGIAIAPNGQLAYVINQMSNQVTPLNLNTHVPEEAIEAGSGSCSIAISPDGTTAYVANANLSTLTLIDLTAHASGAVIAWTGSLLDQDSQALGLDEGQIEEAFLKEQPASATANLADALLKTNDLAKIVDGLAFDALAIKGKKPNFDTPKLFQAGPPFIANLSPNHGPAVGGNSVSISGVNFTGTTSVKFGAISASFIINSDTSLTATAPAGTGIVAVTVTNPLGVSNSATYTYDPPIITNLSPNHGPAVGGNSVSILGTNLSGATSVIFGSSSAVINTVTDSLVTVTAPSGTGTVSVVVITPSGSSNSLSYSYDAPSIINLSPNHGPAVGGNSVSISGTNLSGATSVIFGGSPAVINTVTDSLVTVTAPSGTGTVNVVVITPSGVSNALPYSYDAPSITNLSPNHGPAAGGNSVSISGTNLSGATSVTFGGSPAVINTVTDSLVTVTAPSGTGTVSVVVITPSGVSNALPYSYDPPVITNLSPNHGPAVGGNSVTISGINLSGATSVTFGASSAAIVNVTNTSILVTAPAGTGTVSVVVTTPSGISNALPYSYDPPVVVNVSPNHGPAAGGNSVSISGSNFSGATSVTFGSSAAIINTITDSLITVTAPAGTGTVDVRVTTPSGTSAITINDKYSYDPPVITNLSPNHGPAVGGNSVTISGINLSGATSVTFGATAAVINTVTNTTITVTAPAGTGTVSVRVTTPSGISNALSYSYDPPIIINLSPNHGPSAGGNSVTINGINLSGVLSVTFGGVPAFIFTASDSAITVAAPPGTGTVSVLVTTPSGVSNALSYSYDPPVVINVNPNQGPAGGGNAVIISGINFTGATSITFGVTPASFIVNSDTSIMAIAPPGVGTVDVRVTTPSGTSAITAADQYTYTFALPAVTAVTPNFGPTNGGNAVVISGTNFTGTTSVTFGGLAAISFVVDSDTSITAIAPPNLPIVVDVVVTTSNGSSAVTPADHYTYILFSPVVSGVSPNFGPTTGGNTVTISGANFDVGSLIAFGTNKSAAMAAISPIVVTFGNAPAVILSVTNTTLVVIAPPGFGTVDVRVTTINGSSPITPFDQYTYIASIPLPPTNFKGKVIKNEFATQTEYVHRLSWRPSSDPTVVGYLLIRNGEVIANISSKGPFVFNDHNRRKHRKDTYVLVAFNANDVQSSPLTLTLP